MSIGENFTVDKKQKLGKLYIGISTVFVDHLFLGGEKKREPLNDRRVYRFA